VRHIALEKIAATQLRPHPRPTPCRSVTSPLGQGLDSVLKGESELE